MDADRAGWHLFDVANGTTYSLDCLEYSIPGRLIDVLYHNSLREQPRHMDARVLCHVYLCES